MVITAQDMKNTRDAIKSGKVDPKELRAGLEANKDQLKKEVQETVEFNTGTTFGGKKVSMGGGERPVRTGNAVEEPTKTAEIAQNPIKTTPQNTQSITEQTQGTQAPSSPFSQLFGTETTPKFDSLSGPQVAEGVATGKISQQDLSLLKETDPAKYQEVAVAQKRQEAMDSINQTTKNYNMITNSYITQLEKNVEKKNGSQAVAEFREIMNTDQIKNQKNKVSKLSNKLAKIDEELFNLADDIESELGNGVPRSVVNATIRKRQQGINKEKRALALELQLEQGILQNISDQKEQEYSIFKQAEAIREKSQYDLLNVKYGIAQEQFKTMVSQQEKELDRITAREERREDLDLKLQFRKLDFDEKVQLMNLQQDQKMKYLKYSSELEERYGEKVSSAKVGDDLIFYDKGGNVISRVQPNKGGFSSSVSSVSAVDYIKSKEGFRTQAYLDSAGVPTIGYGFTRINGKPVQMGQTITKEEADKEFSKQVATYQNFKKHITVPLTEAQETALTSFEYNLGRGIWNTTGANIVSAINNGDIAKAQNIMKQHNKARDPGTGQLKVLRGLSNRRTEEAGLLGQTGPTFDEENTPLYSKYNAGDMTSADWKQIGDPETFKKKALEHKRYLNEQPDPNRDEIVKVANELISSKGRLFAGSFLSLPRSKSRTFKANFDFIKDKLTLNNLIDAKANGATFGALSEKELGMIANSATKLSLGLSEKEFEKELQSIISRMGGLVQAGEGFEDIPDADSGYADEALSESIEDAVALVL